MSKKHFTWNGEMRLGPRIGHTWYGFDDLHHPLVQANIKEVKDNKDAFEGYELHIAGGILEGWLTWDIDWVLSGPYNPKKVKELLSWITDIGWAHKIYPDVVYSELLFDVNNITYDAHWCYRSTDFSVKEGKRQDLSRYIKVEDGLYKWWQKVPYEKQTEKMAKGYKYQDPLKII